MREAHPRHGFFLEVTGGFDGEDCADIMDPLNGARFTYNTQQTTQDQENSSPAPPNANMEWTTCKSERVGLT